MHNITVVILSFIVPIDRIDRFAIVFGLIGADYIVCNQKRLSIATFI